VAYAWTSSVELSLDVHAYADLKVAVVAVANLVAEKKRVSTVYIVFARVVCL